MSLNSTKLRKWIATWILSLSLGYIISFSFLRHVVSEIREMISTDLSISNIKIVHYIATNIDKVSLLFALFVAVFVSCIILIFEDIREKITNK